jgi:lipopolysaccharide/colanic/teichoic acid biosynthesis glycosyltransferase
MFLLFEGGNMIRLTVLSKLSKKILDEQLVTLSMRRKFSAPIKRIFDVMVSLLGLIMLAPLFIIIAILIKSDSPGPVFYRGPRTGKNGRNFGILKFRTMYESPESYEGPLVTCKEDERITEFGCWLRDTKINELPQLWNVLKGEMSLVGPRPEDPTIVETWSENARKEILSVKPGITSPASIIYHDEENRLSRSSVMTTYLKEIVPDKIRLDRLYVHNHSFFTDLDIILWTAIILVTRVVKVQVPEGLLFFGPIYRLINRYLSWFFIDLLITFAAAGIGGILWRTQGPLNWGAGNLVIVAALLAILFSSVNSIFGLNRIVWSMANAEDAIYLALSGAFVTFITLLVNLTLKAYHWLPFPALPESLIFSVGVAASLGFLITRYRFRLLTGATSRYLNWRGSETNIGERVMIVGSGEAVQVATWILKHGTFCRLFSIVGIIDDENMDRHGMRVDGCWVLGGTSDLPALIEKHDVGVILLAIPNMTEQNRHKILHQIRNNDVRIVMLTDLLEILHNQLTQPITASQANQSVDIETIGVRNNHEQLLAK